MSAWSQDLNLITTLAVAALGYGTARFAYLTMRLSAQQREEAALEAALRARLRASAEFNRALAKASPAKARPTTDPTGLSRPLPAEAIR